MANKTLCISDEVLFREDGALLPDGLLTLEAALTTWKHVCVFTRRPGLAKRVVGLEENAKRTAGGLRDVPVLVRRILFSMQRPVGSTLLARNCVNWDGKGLPTLRTATS